MLEWQSRCLVIILHMANPCAEKEDEDDSPELNEKEQEVNRFLW